ncbi:hypothetical protein [Streptosporangium sp. CA-115845]|uniref:hypothetical protein n=1 Tax=Streptosporangium sp. CA-115845 TaxID=3240071 RepID=UPI003D8D36D7
MPVSCACFGWSDAPVSRAHLVRNAVLMTVAVAGAVAHIGAGADLLPGGAVIAVAAAAVIVVGILFTDDLASLFAPASGPA